MGSNMNTKTYKVKGMHCASCASIIERTFKKTDGVQFAEVNYGTETVKVFFDESKTNPENLSKKIEPLGYSIIMPTAEDVGMTADEHAAHTGIGQSKKEKLAELKSMRFLVLTALPLAAIVFFIMGWDILTAFKIVSKMPMVWYEFLHHLLV